MRALLVLLACAACNNLLGLDKTTEAPADAPIDAAHYVCDPLPPFTASPTMLVPGCTDYTTDSHGDQIAVASCEGDGNGSVIEQGMPGSSSMTTVAFNADVRPKEVPRLGPAGDTMFVRITLASQMGTFFSVFVRGSDGKWVEDQSQLFTFQNAFIPSAMDTISTPTAGAIDRHVIIHHIDMSAPSPSTFHEFVETRNMGWIQLQMLAPHDLGVLTFSDPYLSEDGLALWFVGTDHAGGSPAIFASIRSGHEATFPPATKIMSPPESSLSAPFVTRDCSRLYFGVGSDTWFVDH